MAAINIFLYAGELSPNDVRLADPTVVRSGGDVTVALTGILASFAIGLVSPSIDVPITGESSAVSAGSITPSMSVPLTGTSSTASAGTPVSNFGLPVTGISSSVSPGSLVPSASISLGGLAGTFTAGNLLPESSLSITGIGAVWSAGDLQGAFDVQITGSETTAQAGFLTPGKFGDRGLGGDDVPRGQKHRGWDREEWKRRVKEPQDALEKTLREAYAELTGADAPVSVLARVDAIVRPVARQVARDIPLRINWARMARDYERANALYRLWQEERELQAIMDDDDEIIMLL